MSRDWTTIGCATGFVGGLGLLVLLVASLDTDAPPEIDQPPGVEPPVAIPAPQPATPNVPPAPSQRNADCF